MWSNFATAPIQETLFGGLMSMDMDGRVRTFNPAAARMLRLDRDDAIGHTLAERFFVAEEFEPITQAILDAVVERDLTEHRAVEILVWRPTLTLLDQEKRITYRADQRPIYAPINTETRLSAARPAGGRHRSTARLVQRRTKADQPPAARAAASGISGRYPDKLLRTLQRRVKDRRRESVHDLVFGPYDP